MTTTNAFKFFSPRISTLSLFLNETFSLFQSFKTQDDPQMGPLFQVEGRNLCETGHDLGRKRRLYCPSFNPPVHGNDDEAIFLFSQTT